MLRRKFRIALASANMKQVDWAKANNVSEPTVTMVLNGKTKSKRLQSAIERFIDAEFEKLNLTTSKRCKKTAA